MELHQLRYFLAIAQTGTFTAASEMCHVSQPSLSAQIAKLEDELGGTLFERGRRGATLTERGDILRRHAADALSRIETARREIEELTGLKRGRVALGCLPTTGAYLLPRLLTAFLTAHPEIHVELKEASSPQLAGALRGFEIDLAILDEAGLGPGIAREELFTEPLVVAVPPRYRFRAGGSIDLASLAEEPFILMKSGHGYRSIVIDALARSGVTPRIVYESDEIETVQRLVEAGLGISLVPRMVRKERGPSYLSIQPPTPSRTLFLAYREGAPLSAAAQAMRVTAVRALGG